MIEERLRRIEDLLTMLLKRIEEIERLVREVDPQAPSISLAGRFMLVFSMPALRALESASTVLKLIPRTGGRGRAGEDDNRGPRGYRGRGDDI